MDGRMVLEGHRRREAPPGGLLVWLGIGLVSVLWASAGVAAKVALDGGLSPTELTAVRLLIASAVTVMYLTMRRTSTHLSRHLFRDGVVLALTQVLAPSLLFAASLQHLTSGAASLLFCLVPVATLLWVERSTGWSALLSRRILGFALCLAGALAVMMTGGAGLAASSDRMVGGMQLLASAGVMAFGGSYAKRHVGHPVLDVLAPEILTATALLLLPALFLGGVDWATVSAPAWLAAAYLALGVTLLPAWLLWWLLRRTDEIRVSLVNYLFPPMAVAMGAAFLGESLTRPVLVSGLVLLTGVALVERASTRDDPPQRSVRPCLDLAVEMAGGRTEQIRRGGPWPDPA